MTPLFWQAPGLLPTLLAPLGLITRAVTARRVARPGWHAPVPVICCGNATVGGTGKTPLCLDIAARLRARGVAVHILSRGHGGHAHRAVRVDPAIHTAADVGDEPMLLAAAAPTWVGADRAATARAAIAAGATALIMDDGLQNPGLVKTCALLVIDGGSGFGNHHLLPAGPLREPAATAAARCRAAIMIGADRTGAATSLPPGLPILQARLAPGPDMLALAGARVVAFAGIGRPAKFFATLEEAGLHLAARVPFADHHRYRTAELARLRQQAAALNATLVTTTKDYARLAPAQRAGITQLGASLAWANEPGFDALLSQAVPSV